MGREGVNDRIRAEFAAAIGRKIMNVRELTRKEDDEMALGWAGGGNPVLVVELDGNVALLVAQDPEGNGPGWLQTLELDGKPPEPPFEDDMLGAAQEAEEAARAAGIHQDPDGEDCKWYARLQLALAARRRSGPDESAKQARIASALEALLEWGRTHTGPKDTNSPHKLLVEAHEALAAAK